MTEYLTVPLDHSHPRKDFKCGKEMLDNYFYFQANQDFKRKLSVCFVLVDNSSNLIKGYYTLSSNSISQDWIHDDFKRKLLKFRTKPLKIIIQDISAFRDFLLQVKKTVLRAVRASNTVGTIANWRFAISMYFSCGRKFAICCVAW